MTIPSARGQLVRNRFRRGDDSGSLVMALLLTLVGVALSALLVPVLVTQAESTRLDARRVNALNAAHTGLEVALGQIQAADTGSGPVGPFDSLLCHILGGCAAGLPMPCALQGNVGTGSTAHYQVTIEYFRVDPSRADSRIATNRVPCDPQGGTSSTAAYALVRSAGTERTSTRTLEATYTFQTSNQSRCRGLYVSVPGLRPFCVPLPFLGDIFGNQAWIISWAGGDGTSYVVIDVFGNCASRAGSTGSMPVSGLPGLTFERCNGSPEQTWTSPPAPFKDIREE
jgi:hypothetical protein